MEASAGRCTGTEQPLSPRAAACRPLAAVQGSVSSSSSAVQLALSPLLLQQQLAAVQGSVSSSSVAVVNFSIGDRGPLAIGTSAVSVPAVSGARGCSDIGTTDTTRSSAPCIVGADATQKFGDLDKPATPLGNEAGPFPPT